MNEMQLNTKVLRGLFWAASGDELEGVRLIAKNYLGDWRWGTIEQMVVEVDQPHRTWAVDIQTSSGDGEYSSFDDYGETMPVYPVRAEVVQTIKWVKA